LRRFYKDKTMKKIIGIFFTLILSLSAMAASYKDSTLVVPTDSIGSNLVNYSFAQNGIQVNCTKGARWGTYFSCNAGQSITFSALRPIKSIRINGWVKKDFEAEASSGDLHYLTSWEDDIESNPVLIVYNIDSTAITLSCVKQLRCYEVAFFFSRNTLDSLPEEQWGFDYSEEIPIPVTLDTVFTQAHVENYITDYGMAYIQLSNGLDTMELNIYTSTADSATLLPVGTYTFDNWQIDGSVDASMGRSEGWDYPSYFVHHILGIYYLVGGTMEVASSPKGTLLTINAESYYGSTITATYEGSLINQPQAIDTPEEETNPQNSHHRVVNKKVNNGQITIIRGEKEYSILGMEIR